MRRVWVFRIVLFLLPLLAFTVLFALAEGGLRIYYQWRGQEPWTTASSKSDIRPISPKATAFELPTQLSKKAIYPSRPIEYHTELVDKSLAYAPRTYNQDIFVLPSNADTRLLATTKDKSEVIYDVQLKTDALGRRIAPTKKGVSPSRHLVFFGCSNTFGEGVGQEETLPYYTAAATQKYRSYNLAVSGGSVSDAWAYTHVLDHLEDIPEKQGYAFYIFIDDHVSRYKGNLQNLNGWIAFRPLVRPDQNGEVQFYGRRDKAKPVQTWMATQLSKSYLLKHIGFNFPPIQEQDLKDFVKIVASVRDAYHAKFGSQNPFVFIFYFQEARNYIHALKPLLDQEKIPYLDYSSAMLSQLSVSTINIRYDGHPNALAHKLVGELIAEDLKLQ